MKRVVSMSALFLAATLMSFHLSAETPPWYSRMLVGVEVGPTGAQFGHSDKDDVRYCGIFDGAEITRRCVEAQSEYLVLWVRDGDYAYYDSQLLPKAPGLGDRDPLREAMNAAAAHDMPIIAYCVVQQGGHFLNEHPEFAMRDMDGNPIGRFCFNSGYLASMKAIVEEQLAYGIDGFHIDMLDQGFGPPYGCWCDACKAEFETRYGHALPDAVSWDERWDNFLAFRYLSTERFMRELYDHIKSVNPDASVDYNYHGNPPFSFEVGQRPVQHAVTADFVTGETGVWGFSALTVGLNVEFYRAATPTLPVQVAMQRGVRMYHDQTTRPLADIRWELLSLLAHGAFVTMVDKTGFDGRLDPMAYERIGAAFSEVRQKREHFGRPSLADVGLYYSHRTRDWIGREAPGSYFASFQGAHKALVYDHIPWGVALDENATLDGLRRFHVVILPNASILSDEEVALFTAYVEAGGNLIVTGLTGCHDRMGAAVERSVLESLIGARLVKTLDSLDNWFSFSEDAPPALRGDTPADWPFLVKGPAAVYAPESAEGFGELLKPFRTTRQLEGREGTDWPMSADAPVGPGGLINTVGKGTVLTFAVSPDYAASGDHHIVEARRLLANAARYLHPAPRVRITAPTTVQAVVSDDPEKRVLRVHLLGYNSPPQTTPEQNRPYILPALIEEAPLYRATVEFEDVVRRAEALNPTTHISLERKRVDALINDIHEVLMLHY